MKNLHNSVMINEIISFLPLKKSINVIDATFGGGGYSKTILEKFNVNQLLAIDRDPISKIFAKEIETKFSNFTLINDKFSKIEEIVNKTKFKDKKFDIILFDIGTSSNQIDNAQRGFSFNKSGPLDMQMGASDKNAYDIINNLDFFSEDYDDFSTSIFSEIITTNIDKEGRFLIPEELKLYAGIKTEAAFFGQGYYFQIWDPKKGLKNTEDSRRRLLKEKKSLRMMLTQQK